MSQFFIFLFLIFLILNPYTLIGPLGYFFVIPFFFYSILSWGRYFDKTLIFLVFLMIFVSFVGVFSSLVHGIGQFEHLKVSFSVLVYVVTGSGLYFLFKRIGRGFDDLVYLSLLAISFNSVVILTEVLFPFVRDVIESFLIPSGNVNWREGFRYRGIAS